MITLWVLGDFYICVTWLIDMVESNRSVGALLIVVVVLVTVIFQLVEVMNILANIGDIWILVAAAVIGYAVNLITKKPSRPSTVLGMQPSLTEDERRRYRIAVHTEITNCTNNLIGQRDDNVYPRRVPSVDWENERPERRPLFFNQTEYQLIQKFYGKLEYWNEIVQNWNLQWQQQNRAYWTQLREHCINSGEFALREIVWKGLLIEGSEKPSVTRK